MRRLSERSCSEKHPWTPLLHNMYPSLCAALVSCTYFSINSGSCIVSFWIKQSFQPGTAEIQWGFFSVWTYRLSVNQVVLIHKGLAKSQLVSWKRLARPLWFLFSFYVPLDELYATIALLLRRGTCDSCSMMTVLPQKNNRIHYAVRLAGVDSYIFKNILGTICFLVRLSSCLWHFFFVIVRSPNASFMPLHDCWLSKCRRVPVVLLQSLIRG